MYENLFISVNNLTSRWLQAYPQFLAGVECITRMESMHHGKHTVSHILPCLNVSQGALKSADAFALHTPNTFMLRPFESTLNPLYHFKNTARQIWDGTGGKLDFLVTGEVSRRATSALLRGGRCGAQGKKPCDIIA